MIVRPQEHVGECWELLFAEDEDASEGEYIVGVRERSVLITSDELYSMDRETQGSVGGLDAKECRVVWAGARY